MDKLKMHTPDIAEENYRKLAALFPDAVTETKDEEGNVVRAIDKDVLMQEINAQVVDDGQERYQFTWPDKRKSVVLANAPIAKTLRFEKEKSVGRDGTPGGTDSENIYIEGDNLDALKLLQETYLGKVKMIYIDPPYNTGNDFIYEDDFSQSAEDYADNSGQTDEEGNRLVQNSESNGRFHTDWLNMLYPRLRLAKDLLTEDGLIFISIDDNEDENLRNICNEIFGKSNALTPFIWPLPRGINAGLIARAHEYVLAYGKNLEKRGSFNRVSDNIEYSVERCNKKIDSRHPESTITFPAGVPYEGRDQVLTGTIDGSEKINIIGKMVFKNGKLAEPVTLSAGWTMKNMILDWLQGKKVYDLKGQEIVGFFFKENGRLYSKKAMSTVSIKSILKDIPDTQYARKEMEELFGSQDIFSYPKTTELPKLFTKLSTDKNDTVMDFFSGSGTTGHAMMKLNAEDNGNRKFIMVQLPEQTDEKSEAYKAGYKTICDIGEERIRRAGKKIKEETGADIDYGFRCFKVDSSNMKDVYYRPAQLGQASLDDYTDNIKEDRTPEDLLIQVMLDLGVELSSQVKQTEIGGKKVFSVADGYLIACFDEDVTEDVVTEIAKRHPFYFVSRDSSMANDSVAANFEEIFKTYSPETVRKVL
jgi:adenine-specific DNA-methyltransferase